MWCGSTQQHHSTNPGPIPWNRFRHRNSSNNSISIGWQLVQYVARWYWNSHGVEHGLRICHSSKLSLFQSFNRFVRSCVAFFRVPVPRVQMARRYFSECIVQQRKASPRRSTIISRGTCSASDISKVKVAERGKTNLRQHNQKRL